MQCEPVFRKAIGILNDAGQVTWTTEHLVDNLNAAALLVVSARPDASVRVGGVELVDGVRQALPEGGHRVIDGYHNGSEANPGKALWKTQREIKNRAEPNWLMEAPSAVTREIILDEHFPDSFWTSPPAIAGNILTLGYTVAPAVVVDPTSPFPLLAKYEPHVLEWMLYLAFARDSEDTPNGARAVAHKNTCLAMLGIKMQADKAGSPAVRKSGTD